MAATDPHPESELLTAFAERSLGQSERELILGHLSSCVECRQILELALPVSETGTVTTHRPARPGWWTWPAVRWGLSTAAILALVSLGGLQYEHWQKEGQMASRSSLREQISAKQGFGSSPKQPEMTAPSKEGMQAPNSARNRETTIRSQPASAKSDFQTAKGTGASDAEGMRSKANAAALARNRPPDQLIQSQATSDSQNQPYINSEVVKAKAAIPPQASVPAFAPPDIPLQTAPSLVQRASPRWAVTASGGLQRSIDAGKTWEEVNVKTETGQAPNKPVFRAVAALGPEVWAGGSGGTLYHSVDSGTRWQQVFPLAAGNNPTADITEIEFSTPQTGGITTSAGEVWTTSDNGQTWQKQ
jgi:hypothetical protein